MNYNSPVCNTKQHCSEKTSRNDEIEGAREREKTKAKKKQRTQIAQKKGVRKFGGFGSIVAVGFDK